MRNLTNGGSLRRARPGLLALCGLAGGLLGGPTMAASFYEQTKPFYLSMGGTEQAGVDVLSGTFLVRESFGKLPSVLNIEAGWRFASMDATVGPYGVGSSCPTDYFVEWKAATSTYEFVGPSNRRYVLIRQGTSTPAVYKDDRSAEMLGATFTLASPTNGHAGTLRWKTGKKFLFNAGGELYRVEDQFGTGFDITRTAQGFTRVVTQGNRTITYNFSAANKVTSVVLQYDPATPSLNKTWTVGYDGSGRVSTITNPLSKTTTLTWTTYTRSDSKVLPLVATIKDARNNVQTSNLYDSLGQCIKQTYPDGGFCTFAYSVVGSHVHTNYTDPMGNLSETEILPVVPPGYSKSYGGVLGWTRDPLGRATSLWYHANPAWVVVQTTDFRNRTTYFTWDLAKGNLLTVHRPNASGGRIQSTATYDATWSVPTSVTDWMGRVTSYQVNAANGLVTQVTAPDNGVTQFGYNAQGHMTSAVNALNQTFTFERSAIGQLLSVTDPAGHVSRQTVDAAGRTTSVTDVANKRKERVYNQVDDPTALKEFLGSQTLTTAFEYDNVGNMTGLVNARNYRTSWVFDAMDRPIEEHNPLGQIRRTSFDKNSRPTLITNRLGQKQEISYTTGDRPSQYVFKRADGTTEATVTLTYDAACHLLTSLSDSVYGTISLGYDSLDQQISETVPNPITGSTWTVAWSLDDLGRRTTLAVPGQSTVGYEYHNNGQVSRIFQGSDQTTFSYDLLGRRTSQWRSNGITTNISYGLDGFPSVIDQIRNSLIFDRHSFGRDAVGNITRHTRNAEDTLHTYDDLHRLVQSQVNEEFTPGNYTVSWTYDAVGNRLSQTLDGVVTNYVYNAADRLTQAGSTAVTTNAEGQVTSAGPDVFQFDTRGRLIQHTQSGFGIVYGYDPFGRRTKASTGIPNYCLHDGLGGTGVVREENTIGQIVHTLRGPGADEIVMRDWKFALTNHLGSTTTLTDLSGNTVQQYAYAPFGKAQQTTGVANPFQFTGKENDGFGLFYYAARYYAPEWGRFLSEDPLGMVDGPNGYVYVGNNPVNHVDPSGLYVPTPSCDFELPVYHGTIDVGGIGALGRMAKTVVIGENMADRVIPYARQVGATVWRPRPSAPADTLLARNYRWIRDRMREGCRILDIGIDPLRADANRSINYIMEANALSDAAYPIWTIVP